MHCIESVAAPKRASAAWALALVLGLAATLPAAAQNTAKPESSAAPKAPAAQKPPAPPKAQPAQKPAPAAKAPAVARNIEEFKKMAARRMVDANPAVTYKGKPQQMLFGIPILEIELNDDATVKNISVVRPPANESAAGTVDIAMEAIRKAAPYGDISRLPKPVKWTEVFLFNDKKQFKPRSLE